MIILDFKNHWKNMQNVDYQMLKIIKVIIISNHILLFYWFPLIRKVGNRGNHLYE